MLPSAALIQPRRGAPPQPLGEGTQGCRQPSLRRVESGNGYQQHGSGWPKMDSVMVSQHPRQSGQQASLQPQSQHPAPSPVAAAVAMTPALAAKSSLAVSA